MYPKLEYGVTKGERGKCRDVLTGGEKGFEGTTRGGESWTRRKSGYRGRDRGREWIEGA